jgi:hypothetical protein
MVPSLLFDRARGLKPPPPARVAAIRGRVCRRDALAGAAWRKAGPREAAPAGAALLRRVLLLAALLLPGAHLSARQAAPEPPPPGSSVRGTVVDAVTGRGIPAALVEFLDQGGLVRASATTTEEGGFLLARLPRGEFRLRVTSLGYARTVSLPGRLEEGEALTLVMRVHPSALALAPLEVTATARTTSPALESFYARAERGFGGAFLTRVDIERAGLPRVSDLVAGIAGVRLDGTPAPGLSGGVFLSESPSGTGGRPCPAQIFLDGSPVTRRSALGGTSPLSVQIDRLVTPSEVEGIEVYRSLAEIPPEFLTTDARCGVIAIWRRTPGV